MCAAAAFGMARRSAWESARGDDHDSLAEALLDLTLKDSTTLRHALNDRVLCKTTCGWIPGTVVGVWHVDPSFPAGKCAAYKVQLEECLGGCHMRRGFGCAQKSAVYVPRDCINLVRPEDGFPLYLDPWADKLLLEAEAREATLRFAVGTQVMVIASKHCEDGSKGHRTPWWQKEYEWLSGTVESTFARDATVPAGHVCAYRVKLPSGALVWAPLDTNRVIQLQDAGAVRPANEFDDVPDLENVPGEGEEDEAYRYGFMGGGPWFERLEEALCSDDVLQVKALVKKYGEVVLSGEGYESCILHDAARRGAADVVEWLIGPHGLKSDGSRACMIDARGCCSHQWNQSLEFGLCPSFRVREGDSPMHHAGFFIGTTRRLISLGANVNHLNTWGHTPLSQLIRHWFRDPSKFDPPQSPVRPIFVGVAPRAGFPDPDDLKIAVIRLLLSHGASVKNYYSPRRDEPPSVNYVYEFEYLDDPLVAFLKQPEKNFVGMQAVPDVQAREGLVLAWTLAPKAVDGEDVAAARRAAVVLGKLPKEIVQMIALKIPALPDPTQKEVHAVLKAANERAVAENAQLLADRAAAAERAAAESAAADQ